MKIYSLKTLLLFVSISVLNRVQAQTNPYFFDGGFSSQYEVYNSSGSSLITFNYPVGIRFNSDGTRMFVWEKAGKVFVCNWNASLNKYIRQSTPVLDITPEVGNWGDMGFLGFTLDPDFNSNGLVYCLYVVDQHYLLNFGTSNYNAGTSWDYAATIGRVTRYSTQVSGGNLVVNSSSRTILLGETASTGIPILYDSHGVGDLEFGSDGSLLLSCGDGASYNNTDAGPGSDSYRTQALQYGIIRPGEDVGSFRSLMLTSYCGKILRIDPATGNGMPSNPFFEPANPGSCRSKVWALGLRNPYRFTVKPNTGSNFPSSGDPGELYISDVGWITYEELNYCNKPGMNFGWPIYEGIFKTGSFSGQTTYGNLNTRNNEEPNPLGGGGCNQYFRFRDLIKDPTPDDNLFLGNPCNSSQAIPSLGNSRRFVHQRPLLEWKHYTDQARVPVFNGSTPSSANVGSSQSGVSGVNFQGVASIGGVFYTGDEYPPQYKNTFFLTDYEQKFMNLSFVFDNTLSQVTNFAGGPLTSLCMTQNPRDGLIYYVSVRDPDAGQSNDIGRIRKLVYGGNQPPVAYIGISNNNGNNYGNSPLQIDFNSNGSYDPEAGPLSYDWNFGDGSPHSTSANPTHQFSGSGQRMFTVTLTVRDNQNATYVATKVVSLNNTPPAVQITNPVNGSKYVTNQVANYTAAANVSDNSPNNQLIYSWQSILRHNAHEHPNSPVLTQSPVVTVNGEGCGGETFYYLVRLTVTDPFGLTGIDSVKVFPDCFQLPVKLLSFSGSEKDRLIRLVWKTTNESFISRYEIERSADGRIFEKIGELPPKDGNGVLIKEYSFIDSRPLSGKTYYRLRIENADGSNEYSSTIHFTLRGAAASGITVYPIPFTREMVVETFFRKSGEMQLRLTDLQGRVLYSRKESVTEGTRIISVGGLDNLLPGIYYLNIIQNGEQRRTKVIKMDD